MCIIELDLRNKKPSCCLLRDEADDRQIKSPWSTDARVNDPKKVKNANAKVKRLESRFKDHNVSCGL